VLAGGKDINFRGTHIPSDWSPGWLLFYVGARYYQYIYGSIFPYIQKCVLFYMHRAEGFR